MKIAINGDIVDISQDRAVFSIVNAPVGCVLEWSGTEDTIPDGWHICNGEDGTFDLRDKFLLGAGGKYSVGDTGGSEEVTLTVDQMPVHQHELSGFPNKITSASYSSSLTPISVMNGSTAKKTSSVGSSQPHPNMPPYYALFFIQKVSISQTDYMTVEEGDDRYIQKTGGTLTGPLNVPTPTENSQAANKQYVDSSISSQVEEYDTDDGWHVRKHSDGYVEMFAKITKTIDASDYQSWGGGYVIPATNYKTFPFLLFKKYGESANLISTTAGVLTQYDGGNLSRTTAYGFWRANSVPFTLEISVSVFGRVSTSTQLSIEPVSISSPSSSEIFPNQEKEVTPIDDN